MCVVNTCIILTGLVLLATKNTICLTVDLNNIALNNVSSETFQDHDIGEIEELNLRRCNITNINEDAFINMTKLTTINLSMNYLPNLPDKLFVHSINIQELFLHLNYIEYLPNDIFSNLRSLKRLELDLNRIRILDPNVFHNNENLNVLALQYNNIEKLPQNIFDKLTSLTELYLQNNSISDIEPTTFDQTRQLQKLQLSYNKLTQLKNGTFSSLRNLEHINLSWNSIKYIEINAFPVSTALKELHLYKNQLQYIDPQTILNLKGLTEIVLSGNPWKCDRRFKTLLRILDELSGAKFYMPRCAEPAAFAGRPSDSLREVDLPAVELTISPNVTTHYAEEGDSVMFTCELTGDQYSNFNNTQWIHEAHTKLTDSKRTVIESALKNGSMLYNLLITNVQEQDTGLYKCIYEDGIDRIEKQINLHLYEIYSNHDLNDSNVTITNVYESNFYSKMAKHVRLPCLLTHHPETNVFWSFNNENIRKSDTSVSGDYYHTEISVITNSTVWFNLTIFNVKKEDSGTYKCEASYKDVLNNKPIVYRNITVIHLIFDN